MKEDTILTPLQATHVHLQAQQRDFLVMWVVTRNTSDYPNRVAARPTVIGRGTNHSLQAVLLADSLDEIRDVLPPGLVQMDRDPNDDPVIVELWL